MTRRRSVLTALLGAAALRPWHQAMADEPGHRVSAQSIRAAVAQRFPRRYPVAGLIELDVQQPELRFMAAENRLRAQAPIEAGGPALRRRYTGALDVEFALRYEATDMTLRAHQIRVVSLQLAGLPPQAEAILRAYAPELARQSWAEVVLHTLGPQDLALPDAMGLKPGRITVLDDGLMVSFEPRTS